MDEGEPDEEGESSDEAANEKDHVDKQPRNKKPPGKENIWFYLLINKGPVIFHRPIDEDQIGRNDDNVATDDAGHVGLVVGHVMPDGEDEGLVVLGKDDCVVDDAAKLKNSQKGSYEPGGIQLDSYHFYILVLV